MFHLRLISGAARLIVRSAPEMLCILRRAERDVTLYE
jgi:hypothetical protein